MYEKHFNLVSRPFTLTPFIDHYFPSASMQKALSGAQSCIERGSGPVIVVGEPGTGKSLLLQLLEQRFVSEFHIVSLVCSKLDKRQELLQNILFELQLPFRNLSEGELRLTLLDFVRSSTSVKQGVLLLVDEAHNLSIELLDEIRLMTQIVRKGISRIPVVLAGNFRLEESLADPRLSSFNQLIATRCYLGHLSAAETAAYVVDHLDRVGGHGKQIFDDAALQQIHELTEGCPRMINQLADHSLMLAATHGTRAIGKSWICDTWSDLQNYSSCTNAQLTRFSHQFDNSRGADCSVIEFGSLEVDPGFHSPDVSQPGWAQAFSAERYSGDKPSGNVWPLPAEQPGEVADPVAGHRQLDAEHADDFWTDSMGQLESYLSEGEAESSHPASIDPSLHRRSAGYPIVEITGQQDDDWLYEVWDSAESLRESARPAQVSPQLAAGLEDQVLPHPHLHPLVHPVTSNQQIHRTGSAPRGTSNGRQSSQDRPGHERSADDPFAEDFQSVEIIQDRYAPLVAAYNRSSLNIRCDELDCLDQNKPPVATAASSVATLDLPSPVPKNLRHSSSVEFAGERLLDQMQSALEVVSGAFPENQRPSGSSTRSVKVPGGDENSLPLPETLANTSADSQAGNAFGLMDGSDLCTAEEFQLLQSLQQLLEEHNGYAAAAEGLRIDQNENSAGESSASDNVLWQSYGEAEIISEVQEIQDALQSVISGSEDDRDIIICDTPELSFNPVHWSKKPEGSVLPAVPVSTGRAQRMNYQQLFEQLRNVSKD
jgi:type II secretory pathway predicted ATPase ExeA